MESTSAIHPGAAAATTRARVASSKHRSRTPVLQLSTPHGRRYSLPAACRVTGRQAPCRLTPLRNWFRLWTARQRHRCDSQNTAKKFLQWSSCSQCHPYTRYVSAAALTARAAVPSPLATSLASAPPSRLVSSSMARNRREGLQILRVRPRATLGAKNVHAPCSLQGIAWDKKWDGDLGEIPVFQ